jgi:hypothetical protein
MLISIDAFRAFFTEKIIRPLKVKYNLTSFIIDIANKFSYVNSVGMASQGTFVSAEGRPTFATFQAPDVGLGEALRAANAINTLGDLGFGGLDRYYHSLNGADPAYYSEIVGDSNPASSPDPRREISYFVLRSSGHVIQRDGDEDDDIEEGIYHLKLGSDKGILKSVKFRRDEIRGRREGRIVRAGGLNLTALREKYDATITIFGAPFIYPGMYIYLNPSLIGYGDGSNSAAKILGLGGYYFINKVRNSISSDGSFDTEIEASWNADADPDCVTAEVDIIQAPRSAANEVLQASALELVDPPTALERLASAASDIVTSAGQALNNNFSQPAAAAVTQAGQTLNSNVSQPAAAATTQAGRNVNSTLSDLGF